MHPASLLLAVLVSGCALEFSLAPAAPVANTPPPQARASTTEASRLVAAVPLRRLTNEEYNHTVRDLFAERGRPADAFPADEVDGGFESNAGSPVSQAGVEHYLHAAETVARSAAGNLGKTPACDATTTERCAERWIERLGRLTYRRPLPPGDRELLLSTYLKRAKSAGHAKAVRAVVQRMLQSPRFLYRLELPDDTGRTVRPLDGFEVATRLSYFLWSSTPDEALLDDAAEGRLQTEADVERATRRMLLDPRAIDGVKNFFRQWLELRELGTLSKDISAFPLYTPSLKQAMVEETLLFGARAVFQGGDGVRELLTSKVTYVNRELAALYGVAYPVPAGFAIVRLPDAERSGVLTHASVMTVLTQSDETSPILRGKFVREKLFCQAVPPPPPGVAMQLPPPRAHQTKRQRFASHRSNQSCSGCHQMMEPLGFAFEHYDALGGWLALDRGAPVDAVGAVVGTDVDGSVDGALELGARLAESEQVRRCMATQWFRAALGRGERPEDERSIDGAYAEFARAGFDLRELIVAITRSDAFRFLRQGEGARQ